MRIIAGEARGRRLLGPKEPWTRPPIDRLRQGLFSLLRDRFDRRSVLDLYAGTGSLGLEAISRGARRAVFVEASRYSIAVLKENIRRLGFGARCEVLHGCALSLPRLDEPGEPRFAVVFVDPPFESMRRPEEAEKVIARIREILESPALEPDGCIVVRQPARGAVPLPFPSALVRRYGRSSIAIIEKRVPDGP